MKAGFRIGDFELTWLNGGEFELDGGAMFGVVPKVLWQKKYPVNAENCVPLTAWPVLVRTPKNLLLIESGIGNKLTDKQKIIFHIQREWSVLTELAALGIGRDDISHVIQTHYDWDHAGGVVMRNESGDLELTFPKAALIIQKQEWDDVLNPNIRTINTYWPVNIELLRGKDNLVLVDGDREIVPGISVHHTAGHNKGHQIVRLESQGETALHLADLLPTHAHGNPLWIMAYDNYPMDSIRRKEAWIKKGIASNAWFTFYHDPFVQACKLDEKGNVIEKWPEG